MEHSTHTPPHAPPANTPPASVPPDGSPGSASFHGSPSASATARSTRAERQARSDWLIGELGRRAAAADDPQEQASLRRTADSLVRLAIAFRS